MTKRTTRAALIVAGIGLTVWGLQFPLLMAAGKATRGVIDYSTRQYGMSRGVIYDVHYEFDVPGQGRYKGASEAAAGSPPSGGLTVRSLPWSPWINHPGSNGMLSLYALICLLPGVLLTWLPMRYKLVRRV
jgi:hypothetical protein